MATRTQLIIEGNLVTKVTIEEGNYDGHYRRETIKGTVELNSLLESLVAQRGQQIFTPRLAEGQIIARKTKGQREAIIVELQPAIRRILEKVEQSDVRSRQCSFPWIYLIVYFYRGVIDRLFIFYRNQPAEDLNTSLYLPNLPNIYGKGDGYKVCTGSMSGCDTNWTITKKIDWIVRSFWDSKFNHDLASHHWEPSHRTISNHPKSFREWEEKTSENPKFILEMQWRASDLTIQQVLDKGV